MDVASTHSWSSELTSSSTARLGQLSALRLRRLLDNEPIELSADQLWEQLNYQLIHAIDFLPPAAWLRTSGTYFFQIFVQLHELLTRAGQLRATVGWDPAWMRPYEADAQPGTWRHYIVDLVPTPIIMKMASKAMARYSSAVGHSLEYSIAWADQAPEPRL